jgi:hypothetical protein
MSKAWCPKCKKYKKYTKDTKCISCQLAIVHLYCYQSVNQKSGDILVGLYSKGDKYYD